MIRVAIAAGSSMSRSGLRAMLNGQQSIVVAGMASDLQTLAGVVDEEHPDVVLVSLERQEPEPPADLMVLLPAPLVVLLDDPQPLWVMEALRGGVRAVLPADVRPEELVAALYAAVAGLIVLHPQEAQPLLASVVLQEPRMEPMVDSLTPRETEVLRMLSAGLSNKLIAGKLDISDHTVKFHVASVMSKLGAGSRTEAVTIGIKQGIILL